MARWRRFRGLFGLEPRRDVEDELAFHLEMRVRELVARGESPEHARQLALERFGDYQRSRAACTAIDERRRRRRLRRELAGDGLRDLRYAGRQWLRAPAFAVTAVATLGLAIAATTTMFALVDAVLVRPLPYADADRLVWVASVRNDNPAAPVTLPEYLDYRDRNRSLAGLAAYANWSASLAGDGITERLQGARLSANAFDLLGVRATVGRLLRDSDDLVDAPRVAVISHRLWRQRFAAAPATVGREIRLNGEPTLIVGVLPAQFPLPLPDVDVVVPLAPDRDPLRGLRSSTNFLRMFGRLGDGVSAEQARQDLSRVCDDLRRTFSTAYAGKLAMSTTPFAEVIVGDHRAGLVLLLGSVAVVLSTTLANLICLVLIRTNDRRGEIAVRMAIGASRARVIRQLAIESAALAVAAGAVGAGLAALATASVTSWAPTAIPRLSEVRLDGRALAFTAAAAVAAALCFTLAPLGVIWRARASQATRLANRSGGGSRGHSRVHDALVVAEIAAALVLLLGTTMLMREFASLQRTDPGFTPEAVFQARVSLPVSYRTREDLWRFDDELRARLTTTPGIDAVGVVSAAPLSGILASVPFTIVGDARAVEAGRPPSTNFRVITPGYFEAAGTRLIRGRVFTDRDRADTQPVAIVSAALADRWLGAAPIGRRVMIDDNNTGPRPVEVVGVVENVRHTSMSGPAGVDLYIPLAQLHTDGVTLMRNNQFWMIRGAGGPDAFTKTFVRAIQQVDRDAAVSSLGSMRQGLENWLAPRRFNLALVSAFAATAVLLAVSGLYGLAAYAVGQRRREIGVHLALGASTGNVRAMILRDATRLAALGIVTGAGVTVAARPLTRWVTADATLDPWMTTASAIALFVVVLLAAAIPARRASRIAPTVALRAD